MWWSTVNAWGLSHGQPHRDQAQRWETEWGRFTGQANLGRCPWGWGKQSRQEGRWTWYGYNRGWGCSHRWPQSYYGPSDLSHIEIRDPRPLNWHMDPPWDTNGPGKEELWLWAGRPLQAAKGNSWGGSQLGDVSRKLWCGRNEGMGASN